MIVGLSTAEISMKRIATFLFVFLFVRVSTGQDPDFDVELAKSATSILGKYCKECHGDDNYYPGLDITDRTTLLRPVDKDQEPFILPGNPGASRIFKQIEAKKMPPEAQKQLSPEDKKTLEAWIAAGAHFPPESRPPRQFLLERTVLTAIQADLMKQTDEQISYTRYFSLLHLWNDVSGSEPTTEEDLQLIRAGVSKLVNSLSNRSRIVRPRIVDPEHGTILAIDIRDYGWDEWHWNQILTKYPYGLKTSSDEARNVVRLTGTSIPYLRADWFIAVASRPPLYHDLLRIPRNAKALEEKLGVNIARNFAKGQLARAAFQNSGVSKQNRMLERHDTTTGGRFFWKSYDMKPNVGPEGDFTRSPLGPKFDGIAGRQPAVFAHDGGEIIYGLPNGLQAYMLVTGEDVRINTGPLDVVSDPNQHASSFEIVNGISCMGCHKHGMIRYERDEIRPIYEKLAGQHVAKKVLELYPPDEVLKSLLRRDEASFLFALEEAIGPFLRVGDEKNRKITDFAEPITKTSKQYLRNVTLADAARELGLPNDPEVAERLGVPSVAKLEALSGLKHFKQIGLANLATGGVTRAAWERAYHRVARELRLGVPVRPR